MAGTGRRQAGRQDGALPHELMRTCMSNLLSAAEERVYFKDLMSRFLLVSAGWMAAYAPDRTAAELIGKTDFDVFSDEHARAALADEQEIIRTGKPAVGIVEEETYLGRAGTWASSTKMALRDGHGRIIGTFGITRDITAQVQAEKELARQALHDPLTGLVNRIALMDRLSQALAALDRHPSRLAVLFIDLDNFKEINDSFGHDAGDLVLAEVSRRLLLLARHADTVARLGGDEFVMLCGDLLDDTDLRAIGDRIVRAIAMSYADSGRDLSVTCSVGIAVDSEPTAEPDRLIRDADSAMYAAKKAGRNRCQIYSPAQRSPAQRSLLHAELCRALERGELFLVYEPKFSLETRLLNGAEALVRWRHPERGIVPPGEFMPFAEDQGLIEQIGAFVLDEACRQLAEWTSRDGWPEDFTMAVSISGRELSDPGLPERVAGAARRHGIDPRLLFLEITGTALTGAVGDVQGTMTALSAAGVRIALDDWGTGYSALAYLQWLKADALKIDRRFVEQADRSPRDREIVAAVIAMSHALGMSVVAMGIQTSRQLETLAALHCEEGQGHFFAPPVPPAAIITLADRRALT
jgi:diguanylate cyclase (GGDEF)-like protein